MATVPSVVAICNLCFFHLGDRADGWLQRNMMRVGWGYMMKKLIPKVLGNVRDGRFTPGAIPLDKRAYECETVPENYVR